jgi:ABC-type dipeptide/oligopeptide/nickel transport system permease component
MARYLGRRLLATLVTVWIVATAGFLLVELIPGDPARSLAGPAATSETLARIREAYGFDDPLPVRYATAMARMAQGDLGVSFSRGEPVTDVLLRSLPPTLLLTGLAFLVEVLVGVPLALWVTSRRGGLADRLLLTAAGATSAIPAFLVGLLLIYVFAFRLGWLPLGGAGSWQAYILPVATLGVPFGLVLARLLRTSLLEQAEQPYIAFALGMGERPWSVRIRHLLPNALLPLFSLLALDFAGLFSSVAVVEVVFSMPGLGADLLTGLRRLDTALIVGIGIVAGLLVALVNLLADLAVIAVDPRVRR